MKDRRDQTRPGWQHAVLLTGGMLSFLTLMPVWCSSIQARDLLPQKEQTDTGFGKLELPSFDQQKRGSPQSMFVWIVMAKGYEVEWDTFGRVGWYTQDPRIKPIDPASSFPPDTPAIYIVFEVPPLEDPAQFSAEWFLEDEKGQAGEKAVGKDSLFIPWHEKHGFLELRKPTEGWKPGT